MATYAQVSQGSSDSNTVLELQKKLNEKGNYGLQEDGIFGAKTLEAVKDYQSKNSLQVDGIVGEKTWGSLLGGSSTNTQTTQQTTSADANTLPDYSAYQYDASTNDAYNQADAMLKQAQSEIVTPTYDYDAVQEAYEKILNRDKFSYDLNGDALYQQYKDQYTTQGKLAMMDAMGQAAALTGGYGSSYAQSAGQQAYQGYLQQLNEVVPELYQLAYDQYQQEGEDLLTQYSLTKDIADTKYGVDQDAYNAAWQNVNYWTNERDTAWNNDFNTWYTAQQLGMTADDTAYNRLQNEKEFLSSMISAGYNPTDAELEAVGMTRGQSDSLLNAYNQQVAAAAASSGGSSGGPGNADKSITYKEMSMDEMDEWLARLNDAKDDAAINDIMSQMEIIGYDPDDIFALVETAENDSTSMSGPITNSIDLDEWLKSRMPWYQK